VFEIENIESGNGGNIEIEWNEVEEGHGNGWEIVSKDTANTGSNDL
jgi:hypothetical protein